jgi:hypothetical protein
MVRTHTGNFTQDVPELLNTHAGAATNELAMLLAGLPRHL